MTYPDNSDRRLAAIMYADAKEYSRLMAEDERGTISEVSSIIDNILQPTIKQHHGRVIRIMGDGMLVEFASVVSAVNCGVLIQQTLARRNQDIPEKKRIVLRIGINLGDVVVQQNNVTGGDVNIAARLESIADPGTLCISRSVYDVVKSKIPMTYEYVGKRTLKNIPDPVEVYRVLPEKSTVKSKPVVSPEQLTLPSKPSLVVMPLKNLAGQNSEQFFCDGMTEGLIANLSRFKELFVISRHSVFAVASQSENVMEIGKTLGVRYVLEGSFLKAGAQVRIIVQLIDVLRQGTCWAEQYTREFEDVFAVQDEITKLIIGALLVQVEEAERQRIHMTETSDLEAYGYLLQGRELEREHTEIGVSKAIRFYERAIESDPNYATAYAALSRSYNLQHRYSWADDPDAALVRALQLAKHSVDLDPADPRGYAELGTVHLYMKNVDVAIEYFLQALKLNPNDADIIAGLAEACLYQGRTDEALEQLKIAMRLNPYAPDSYLWKLADIHFVRRDYEAVIRTVRKMGKLSEGARLSAASAAYLGRMEEAEMYAKELLKKHPNFSISSWMKHQPDTDPSELDHLINGLRLAGLPE